MKHKLRIYLEILLFNNSTNVTKAGQSNRQTGFRLDIIPVFYTYLALDTATHRKTDKKSYAIQWLFFRLNYEQVRVGKL